MTDEFARAEFSRAGVRLSYLRAGGTGDLVVLLHGLAGSAQEMAPTGQALLDHHRVIALDQRGHGHSTRRPPDLSRQSYVDDVIALINDSIVPADEAITPPIAPMRPADVTPRAGDSVTLVGQSMGAHTALLVAAARPDLVRRLVMLEGGVGGSADDYPARLGRYFASWPVPFADENAAREFLGPKTITGAWVRDMEPRPDGLWPRFDPDVMEAAIRGVADVARWDAWERLTAPTLLVRGEHGTVDDGEWHRMLRLRPDAEHVVVPDAGHDVHLDQPNAWTTILHAFLRVT
jgi:pimeloyl-ACP methyl ester carboxylesterase